MGIFLQHCTLHVNNQNGLLLDCDEATSQLKISSLTQAHSLELLLTSVLTYPLHVLHKVDLLFCTEGKYLLQSCTCTELLALLSYTPI